MILVEQREYIENFLKFVSSFLITEDATIREIELVEANLDILKERIQKVKETVIKAFLYPLTLNLHNCIVQIRRLK